MLYLDNVILKGGVLATYTLSVCNSKFRKYLVDTWHIHGDNVILLFGYYL
jgi:hypothetical protein